MANLTFMSNYAPYGSDVASYPTRIVMEGNTEDDIVIDLVGSGVTYDTSLTFVLVDYDNQTMVLDSSSIIEIDSISSSTSVSGINEIKVEEGIATFRNLIFTSKPGDVDVQFELTSKALDFDVLRLKFGDDYAQDPISVSFRYCMPGEYLLNNE